jgi:hypothetical protein
MSDTPRLMTAEELAAIRGRAAATTPGRWTVHGEDNGAPCVLSDTGFWVARATLQAAGPDGKTTATEANAAFIAAARQDVPALLAHVDALEGLLRDTAADEGRGVLLRYRRALEAVANDAGGLTIEPPATTAARLKRIAREALAGGE